MTITNSLRVGEKLLLPGTTITLHIHLFMQPMWASLSSPSVSYWEVRVAKREA